MSEEGLALVGSEEVLARFVLYSKWVRSDLTVRADAFIPYPHRDLSVTRHLGLREEEIWELGEAVAEGRGRLYGRADVFVGEVKGRGLRVVPSEPPRNHANIVGWPAEKAWQKMIALEVAEGATYVSR